MKGKTEPIGTIKISKSNGGTRKRIKTATGWKDIGFSGIRNFKNKKI